MSKFKTISIRMKGGKSRMQRVKVLASGKYKFVKNIKRSSSSKKSSPKTKSKKSSSRKGGKRMAKNKKRGGGRNIQGTIFKWIRVGALVAPGAIAFKHGLDSGWGIEGAVDQVLQKYTGYSVINQTYDPQQLIQGWGPYLMSVLTTVGIPKLAAIIRRL